MITRSIGFVAILNCALAAWTCCEVRGGIIVAGTDTVPGSSAIFTLTIDDPFITGGFTETLSLLSGPFDIERQLQSGVGDGAPTSFIPTEIRDLTLTGTSSTVGSVTVRVGDLNGVQQNSTFGQIDKVVTATAGAVPVPASDFVSGDSFFDVFFEVEVAGVTLYNRQPHRVEAAITELPPVGSVHFPPGFPGFVNLYMRVGATNDVSDPRVGQAGGSHEPLPYDPTVPEPSSLALLGLGCAGLLGHSRRSHKRQQTN